MSNLNSFQSAVLNSTNYYRQHYQAQDLVWNDTLAEFAENYANGCIWQHSGGPYGENLAAGYPSTTLAIDAWADEEKHYNFGKGKFGEQTGHFTQLVWTNTTSVGCGQVDCDNSAKNGVKGQYLICEYWPRGNVLTQFKDNVKKAAAVRSGGVDRTVAALVAVSVLLSVVA